MTTSRYYLNRKLHSLLGVIPLGAFLVEHLLSNYTAYNEGPAGFVKNVLWLNSLPLVLALEIFFIWLPLLYHGVYGLFVAYTARHNTKHYGYFRNMMFKLQRYTGVITLIFVAWHFFNTRFQVTLGNVTHEGLGVKMHGIATDPLFFAFYTIGVICATFHFSNGLWNFLVSWGITVGPRAQRVSTYVCMGLFVLMSVMFILSLYAFTGSEFETTPVMTSLKG